MDIRTLLQVLRVKVANNRDYFSGVVVSYVSQGLQIMAQLLLVPLYIASLGLRDFGVLMMIMTLVAGANIIATWSIGGITRSFSEVVAREDMLLLSLRYAAAKYVFIGCAGLFLSVVALLGLGISPFVVGGLRQLGDGSALAALAGAGVLVLLTVDSMVEMAMLTARKRLAVAWTLQIVGLCVFVPLVVLWLKSGGGLAGIFPCMAVGTIVARLAVWAYWRRQNVPLRWRLWGTEVAAEGRNLLATFRQGYVLYSLIFAALQLDTLLVGILGNPVMVGQYALIWKIAEVSIFFLWRLSENLQPELLQAFAKGAHERAARLYRHGILFIGAVSLVSGIVYALFGQWVVGLWVVPGLVPRDAWAYALAGAAVFWLGTARLSQMVAFASGRLRGLVLVSGIEVLVRWVLFASLFPTVGYLAPLIAINAVHMLGCAWIYMKIARSGVSGYP